MSANGGKETHMVPEQLTAVICAHHKNSSSGQTGLTNYSIGLFPLDRRKLDSFVNLFFSGQSLNVDGKDSSL